MMVLLLRALARVAETVFLVVLALFGLGVALYCFDGLVGLGGARPDRLLDLASVRRHVGHVLNLLGAPGSTAGLALLCGLGAMALGLLLLIGLLAPQRRRLAILDRGGSDGTVAARPRVLRDVARTLAARADGVSDVKRPRLALRRRGGGGRLTVTAAHPTTVDQNDVRRELNERLEPITTPFHLAPRVRLRRAESGGRVR